MKSVIPSLLLVLSVFTTCHGFTSEIRIKEVHQRKLESRLRLDESPYPDLWFEQPIDHFDKKNNKTFRNRYLMETKFYKPGGPVILYNAGEAPLSWWSMGGRLFKVANLTKALVVAMEHRYYGKSIPVPDFSGKNMKYLTVEQALQDMAHFINTFKMPANSTVKLNEQTKWIVMGGSYPGNLAAWMRKVFPRFVFAAYSSSAPVRAKREFFEYDLAVQDALPPNVTTSLAAAVEKIDEVVESNNTQEIKNLQAKFGLEEVNDKTTFASVIVDIISYSVQYGDRDYLSRFATIPPLVKNDTGSNVDQIIKSYGKIYQMYMAENNITVGDLNNNTISDRIEDNPGSSRQWYWQICTQFGYWQVAPKPPLKRLRSKVLTPELYEQGCKEIFGAANVPARPEVEKINRKYGSDRVKTSRIVFVNGQFDPWRRLSVSAPDASPRDPTPDQPLAVVERGYHCDDLLPPTKNDSSSLTAARKVVDQALTRWIREYVPAPDPSMIRSRK